MPPEIQAAVDAGNVEETTKLLATAPESMSKALKKKLLKNAEIAAKKLAKGGVPAAPKPAAAAKGAAPATDAKPAAASKAAPAPVAAVQRSDQGIAGSDELELVTALLASAEALGLADDAVAKLRDNTAALALSISPHVGALRNAAYSSGFTAHGSRAAA